MNRLSCLLPACLLTFVSFLSMTAMSQTELVLHRFAGYPTDGAYATAPLVFDAKGNLFGTTEQGGQGNGIVFEFTPRGGGGYTYHKIYAFKTGVGDGQFPEAGMIFDAKGNLYGTTFRVGA